MAFLTLDDGRGEADVVIFPDLFMMTASKLNTDDIVYVNGKISKKDESVSVICGNITAEEEFDHMIEHMQLCIKIQSDKIPMDFLEKLCTQYKGNTEICFYLTDLKKMVRPRKKLSICLTMEVYNKLQSVINSENMGLI